MRKPQIVRLSFNNAPPLLGTHQPHIQITSFLLHIHFGQSFTPLIVKRLGASVFIAWKTWEFWSLELGYSYSCFLFDSFPALIFLRAILCLFFLLVYFLVFFLYPCHLGTAGYMAPGQTDGSNVVRPSAPSTSTGLARASMISVGPRPFAIIETACVVCVVGIITS